MKITVEKTYTIEMSEGELLYIKSLLSVYRFGDEPTSEPQKEYDMRIQMYSAIDRVK